jgi:hypothetical protein
MKQNYHNKCEKPTNYYKQPNSKYTKSLTTSINTKTKILKHFGEYKNGNITIDSLASLISNLYTTIKETNEKNIGIESIKSEKTTLIPILEIFNRMLNIGDSDGDGDGDGDSDSDICPFDTYTEIENEDIKNITKYANKCRKYIMNTDITKLSHIVIKDLLQKYKKTNTYFLLMKQKYYKDIQLPSLNLNINKNTTNNLEDPSVKLIGWVISSHILDIIKHPTILNIINDITCHKFNILNFLCWPLAKKTYIHDNLIECTKFILSNVKGIDIFRKNSENEDVIESADFSVKSGIITPNTRDIFAQTIITYFNIDVIDRMFICMYNKLSPKNMKVFVPRIAYFMVRLPSLNEKMAMAMVHSIKCQPQEAIRGDYSQRICDCVTETLKQIVLIRNLFAQIKKQSKKEFEQDINKLTGINKHIMMYIGNSDSIMENPIDNMIASLVKITIQTVKDIIKSKKDIYTAKYISASIGEIYRNVKRSEIVERFISELFNSSNDDNNNNNDDININRLQCIAMFIKHSNIKWSEKLSGIFKKVLCFGISKMGSSKMCMYKIDDIINQIEMPIHEKINIVAISLNDVKVDIKIRVITILKINEDNIDEQLNIMKLKNNL